MVVLFLSGVQSLHSSFAESSITDELTRQCVAVFYPDVGKPYDAVFKQILSGIEQTAEVPVNRILIDQKNRSSLLMLQKNTNKCAVLIGLGREGLKVVSEASVPAIVGAVIIQPGDITAASGISLIPQPQEMFKRLVHFVPQIKTVYVVYNSDNNGKLVQLAAQVANKMNIKLQAIEAENLRLAFTKYKSLIEKMDTKSSALWFLQDPATVDTRTILPYVLKRAWHKKIVLFSNQAGHAKNGVLFSVYPDNIRLGKNLGKLAQQCLYLICKKNNMMLLSDLLTAINIRTANRLGLRLNTRRDSYINIIFPRR